MYILPEKNIVEAIRRDFTAGTRVRLRHMDDVQAPPIGTLGTVVMVDDIGTIHVKWDNGSGLGVSYGEDACEIVDDIPIEDMSVGMVVHSEPVGTEWTVVEKTDDEVRLCYQKPGIFARTGKPYGPVFMTVTKSNCAMTFTRVQ